MPFDNEDNYFALLFWYHWFAIYFIQKYVLIYISKGTSIEQKSPQQLKEQNQPFPDYKEPTRSHVRCLYCSATASIEPNQNVN